ncbi:histidinol-phosphate transaminase [Secundilactobacillus muriivasis]
MVKQAISKLTAYTPELTLAELKQQRGLDKLVRLSANENAFGTSPKVGEALRAWNFTDANRYPDSNVNGLRQLIATRLNIDPATLVFGDGLDEIIQLLSRTLLAPDDEVVLTQPTFSEYALHAAIEGAKLVDVPATEAGETDLDALAAAVTDKTQMIWLCNPNNPTSTYVMRDAIEAFMAKVPERVTVVVDEAYIDFVTAEANPSALALMSKFSNLVVLRTFSKAYGLANFRVGYAVVAPALASTLQTVRLPYNLSSFAEIAAEAAYKDQAFVDQVVQTIAAEREKWTAFLTEQGVTFYEPQANFIFMRIEGAADLAEKLLQNGYLVRTGLGDEWLRISIGKPEDNQAVQQIVSEFLQK